MISFSVSRVSTREMHAHGLTVADKMVSIPIAMRFSSVLLLSLLVLAGCVSTPPKPVRLDTVNVLPLELNPAFEIRKIKRFFNEPAEWLPTLSESAAFERSYYNWGAVDINEYLQKQGNYYDIYWRTSERADVTVRLEYRQLGLGNTVNAQELYYPEARGSYRSQFQVTGDEYLEFGRVSAWRILLIVEGRIVAFRQSFMWR